MKARRLLQKLVRANRDHLRHWNPVVYVLESTVLNAWVYGGGPIFITTRALDQNNGRVSAILAHELGHLYARHGDERMAFRASMDWFATTGRLVVTNMFPFLHLIPFSLLSASAETQQVPMVPGHLLSQETEFEADLIGAYFLARACFELDTMPRALEVLTAGEPVDIPEYIQYYRDHPNRIGPPVVLEAACERPQGGLCAVLPRCG
jgi:Zn-dependent protease with chaperone function